MKRFLAAMLIIGAVFAATVGGQPPDPGGPECVYHTNLEISDVVITSTWDGSVLTVAEPDDYIDGARYGVDFIVPVLIDSPDYFSGGGVYVALTGIGDFKYFTLAVEYDDTLFNFKGANVDSTVCDLAGVVVDTLGGVYPPVCTVEEPIDDHVYRTVQITVTIPDTTYIGNNEWGVAPYTNQFSLLKLLFDAPGIGNALWGGWEKSASFTVYCNNTFPNGTLSSWFWGSHGPSSTPCKGSKSGTLTATSGCYIFDMEGWASSPKDSLCDSLTVGRTCIPCLVCDSWDRY